MDKEKTIGILGGMGPAATADLFTKIVSLTKADRDNEHIRIYVDNNTRIPDRTQAILFGGEDPLPYMLESAKKLEEMGADIFILGCTEIPLAFEWLDIKDPCIDATVELAKAAIHFCGKKVREIRIH